MISIRISNLKARTIRANLRSYKTICKNSKENHSNTPVKRHKNTQFNLLLKNRFWRRENDHQCKPEERYSVLLCEMVFEQAARWIRLCKQSHEPASDQQDILIFRCGGRNGFLDKKSGANAESFRCVTGLSLLF